MKKHYLLAPGPTPVPERALLAMAQPIIHHRTPQFSEVFAEACQLLKFVFQTEQDVLILSSSGTGAMESSIVNLFSPGDEVIAINGGKFGERWGKIWEVYDLKVHWVNVECEKAVKTAKKSKGPGFYSDMKKKRKTLPKKPSAYAPAVSLITGLRETLLM